MGGNMHTWPRSSWGGGGVTWKETSNIKFTDSTSWSFFLLTHTALAAFTPTNACFPLPQPVLGLLPTPNSSNSSHVSSAWPHPCTLTHKLTQHLPVFPHPQLRAGPQILWPGTGRWWLVCDNKADHEVEPDCREAGWWESCPAPQAGRASSVNDPSDYWQTLAESNAWAPTVPPLVTEDCWVCGQGQTWNWGRGEGSHSSRVWRLQWALCFPKLRHLCASGTSCETGLGDEPVWRVSRLFSSERWSWQSWVTFHCWGESFTPNIIDLHKITDQEQSYYVG